MLKSSVVLLNYTFTQKSLDNASFRHSVGYENLGNVCDVATSVSCFILRIFLFWIVPQKNSEFK